MALITIAPDQSVLAEAAAEYLTSLIEHAIVTRGNAIVSLTGGKTPRQLYTLLADSSRPWRDRIRWPLVYACWGDERHVPPDHPESNFRMAREALLDHVPIPPSHVHPIPSELPDPAAVALHYDATLEDTFVLAGRADRTFDVMLLGVGEDAHIASVFPRSPLLEGATDPQPSRSDGRVAAVWVPYLAAWRITLVPAAILDAHAIVMLVAGSTKADAVFAGIAQPEDVRRWPAQLVRAAGDRVRWIIDQDAAARLPAAPPS